MINLPPLINEAERLAALHVLEILDTAEEKEFDNIVRLAAVMVKSPVAALTFVDKDRIWYKAKFGLEWNETPRSDVASEIFPYLIALPVVVSNDLVIGHLTVAGDLPIELDENQYQALHMLTEQAVSLLQLRLPVMNKSVKEFYESILNNIPTDIVVFDAEHKYLFANPGAIKNEEYRKFIIGKDDFEYNAYRRRDPQLAVGRREKFLQVKRTGKVVGWEESQTDPDGNVVTYLRRMFPVHDEQGNLVMVIGFGVDITERKLMEEKQTRIMEQMAMQNVQLSDFCNVVSHNLRGPLINMAMLAEFIQEAESVSEQKLLVSKLEPVIDNLKSTFNELVESIQIRQDSNVQSDRLSFEVCLQEVLKALYTEISKAKAKIIYDFEDAPVIVYPHKYLASIFYNLISNAIRYQSPERQLSVNLASKRDHGNIILTVQDNGLGIDMVKHKDSLFKIGKVFHRHPDAKGLGLFMTKTQVEAMGGRIWAESYPGQGSVFGVEFVNQNSVEDEKSLSH